MPTRPRPTVVQLESRVLFAAVPAVAAVALFPFAPPTNSAEADRQESSGLSPASAGQSPAGAVYADPAGNLFGVTRGGGPAKGGTVWELPAGARAFTVLAAFDPADQPNPNGGVVADAAGNLYGTFAGPYDPYRRAHGGGVWRYDQATGTLATAARFDHEFAGEGTTGSGPTDGPALDAAGNLYGTATAGGANEAGVVWELPAGSDTIVALASFGGAAGTGPAGGVAVDAGGNVYGTTAAGRTADVGTVWALHAGRGELSSVEFGHGAAGGLVGDGAGHFYGATDGTVFRLDPTPDAAPTVTPVGSAPAATASYLTVAGDGTIYLANADGGPNGLHGLYNYRHTYGGDGLGAVYRLTPGGDGLAQAVAAPQTVGLNQPSGPLLVTAGGDLIGLAASGLPTPTPVGFDPFAPGPPDPGAGGLCRVTAAQLSQADAAPRLAFATVPATVPIPAPHDYKLLSNDLGPVTVQVRDAAGRVVTGDTGPVTIALYNAPSTTALFGTTTVSAVDGVATFTDLRLGQSELPTQVVFPLAGTVALLATAGTDRAAASAAIPFVAPGVTGASVRRTLPATVLAGTGRGTVAVAVTNGGADNVTVEQVAVYATAAGVIAPDAVPIGLTTRRVPVRPGRRAVVPVAVRTVNLAAGTYTLLARTFGRGGTVTTDVPVGSLTVGPATVALTAEIVLARPAVARAGGRAVFLVDIANHGTITATGSARVSVRLSAEGQVVATVTRPLAIRPSRGKRVAIAFRVPPGTYTPRVTVLHDGITTDATGTKRLVIG